MFNISLHNVDGDLEHAGKDAGDRLVAFGDKLVSASDKVVVLGKFGTILGLAYIGLLFYREYNATPIKHEVHYHDAAKQNQSRDNE